MLAGLFNLAAGAIACASTFRDVPRDGDNEVRQYLGTATRAPSAHEVVDTSPTRIWRTSLGRGTLGAPAVGERITTLATVDRWVYAVATRTGAPLWRYRGDAVYGQGPVMAGGRVYVASEGRDGRLTAISLLTGRRRWSVRAGDVGGPLALADSGVYGVTQDGMAFARRVEDGRVRWSTRAVRSRGGPLVTGGRVIVAGMDDSLAVIDAASGRLLLRVPLPAAVLAPPALLDDSTVVVASPTGLVAAVALADGRARWTVRTGAAVAGAPAVRGDTVFALTTSCALFVIPVTHPASADSTSLGCVTATGPTLLRHGVLVATVGGEVIFHDRLRGRRVWTRRPGGELRHPPVVRNGQIVVGSLLGQTVSYR